MRKSSGESAEKMGSAQSSQVEEKEEDEEDEGEDDDGETERRGLDNPLMKKVLEQEPEILPCYASASPLSPQLSSLGTPRLGPSIKVWDPYNVLAPPPFSRSSSLEAIEDERTVVEVFLICNGECQLNLRPDVISGRCPQAPLTPNGKRQARALAVFLNSQGVRFNAVYSSPLSRARMTALSVCQEMNFAEEQIQSSDALLEMSQGHWEGCHRSEVYGPETVSLIDRLQPDFTAPSGESLREVEFRMVQFLNKTVLRLPEKLLLDFSSSQQSDNQGFLQDGPFLSSAHWESLNRHRQGLLKKKSGKSRLQFVTTTEDHETEGEVSPNQSNHTSALQETNLRGSPSYIAVFTHAVPIKCLLTGLLGCSPVMSHKICLEDSSVTVLHHSWKTGWQIKRVNDTSHLRLL